MRSFVRLNGGLLPLVGLAGWLIVFGYPQSVGATSLSCAAGATCDFHLTQSNTSLFDGNIDFVVHVDNTGANTIVTLSLASVSVYDLATADLLGIDRFAYNSASGIQFFPTGWSACGGQGNISEFGNFSQCVKNPGSTDTNPSFALAGLVASFGGTSPEDTHFAIHARFSAEASCGLFAGDANVSTKDPAEECQTGNNPTSAIPEPSTWILIGVALIGLAGAPMGPAHMLRHSRANNRSSKR